MNYNKFGLNSIYVHLSALKHILLRKKPLKMHIDVKNNKMYKKITIKIAKNISS